MSTQTVPPAPSGPPDQTPSPVPPRPGAPGEDFFARIRALGVVRPDQGRWAAGVAAGLARRWGVDPILIRGAFVALSIVGGAGIALYGLCWLFLPHPDGRIHAQEVLSGKVTAGFVGGAIAVLVNLGDLFGSDRGWFWRPFGLVPLVVAGIVLWILYTKGHFGPPRFPGGPGTGGTGGTGGSGPGATPSAPPTPGTSSAPGSASGDPTAFEPGTPGATDDAATSAGQPWNQQPWQNRQQPWQGQQWNGGQWTGQQWSPQQWSTEQWAREQAERHATRPLHWLTFVTLGVALLAGVGAGAARVASGGASTAWLVGAATGLAVVAVGLVVAGFAGRRGGGLAPIAVLLSIVCLNGMFWRGPIASFGERTWAPAAATEVASGGYNQGAGDVVLDLTKPGLLASATTASPLNVAVHVGAGHAVVRLPQGVAARVDGKVGLGEIDDRIAGRVVNGGGNELSVRTGTGDPVLVVTADLGVGQLEVTQ